MRPRVVEQGAVADIRVELPQLRAGDPPRRLEIAGAGIEVISVSLRSTDGAETDWDVRLRADSDAGIVPLVLRAVYADGASVEVDEQLTVVPAAEGSGFPIAGVVAGILLALAFAGVSVYLTRRKA